MTPAPDTAAMVEALENFSHSVMCPPTIEAAIAEVAATITRLTTALDTIASGSVDHATMRRVAMEALGDFGKGRG